MRENRARRQSKGSDGRSVRVGSVGPKPKPEGAGDGQPVNIPVLVRGVQREGVGEAQPTAGGRWQAGVTARDAGEPSRKCAADHDKKSALDEEGHDPYPKPTPVDE